MFRFLDDFSYCCSGNPFQLGANTRAPAPSTRSGEVTLSGPAGAGL